MAGRSSDQDWEDLGAAEPYFSVLAHERFRRESLTASSLEEFFASGREDVDHALSNARQYFGASFAPRRALDFGCGVGRLTIPMAREATTVVGVDVSRSMLQEAERNCKAGLVENVALLDSDSFFELTDTFDFIVSLIVFQHIPVARGERILARLLHRLDDGGVCVVHFTYAVPRRSRVISLLVQHVPVLWALLKTHGDPRLPRMQMNAYNLNRIYSIIRAAGISRTHVLLTNHDGYHGVTLYCQRERRPSSG